MPPAGRDVICGLILAGGQGTRMGGADKGLVEYNGRPLIEHVLDRFAPQVGALMVSANRNLDRYRAYVARVFSDGAPGRYDGPLAGIAAGLRHAPSPWVAVVPCDVPQLPLDLVTRLADAIQARGATAACARAGGRLQPLFVLLSVSLRVALESELASGGRAVHRWLAAVGAVPVDFDDGPAFRNLNDAAALAASTR
jgi:molybdopterin-guanine dinucleotide biosynthesis protein A